MLSSLIDAAKISERISIYLSEASLNIQLPIAEAMLTYKERRFV
jgi:hypothetical protein